MRKTRLYFQNEEMLDTMLELVVDKSLHICLLNEYKKKDSPWTIITSQAFLNEDELNRSLETSIEALRQLGYKRSGYLKVNYKVDKLDESNDVRWLVKEYAEDILMREAYKTNPERFEFRIKSKYRDFILGKLSESILAGKLPESFDIEAQAKVFIKSTGYKLNLASNGVISFYQTKRQQAEERKLLNY